MNKSLENLARLCQKMQARYGAQDPMVLQLFEDLAAKKSVNSSPMGWTGDSERRTAEHPRVYMRTH